ncbi:MAG: type II toxin-antitoxin system HicB family antitoxin [Clostridia bacterium]|nr:type II toxin-antitoxin system HicB family antitoxin [Clostridia bacterium]
MKRVYPVIFTSCPESVLVYVPDFNIDTEGKDYADAIEMARDAICITAVSIEDDGDTLPEPSAVDTVKAKKGSIVTLVDVDVEDYRQKNNMRSVRRNVTLPAYLDYAAEKSGINVSAVLQAALKRELNLN